MKYEIKSYSCPKCGCSELRAGKLSGYGALTGVERPFRSSVVICEFCSNCGYIIASYVKDPYKF